MRADNQYIKHKALDFANVPLINRDIIASVHLENREDELFWDTLLQSHRPGKYNYIYESRIAKNSIPASGVNQCLRYKPYLSKTFFVCIDSDLRYLLQEPEIDARHYILQTYTYSWENHYCFAEQIQTRLAELSAEAASKAAAAPEADPAQAAAKAAPAEAGPQAAAEAAPAAGRARQTRKR